MNQIFHIFAVQNITLGKPIKIDIDSSVNQITVHSI